MKIITYNFPVLGLIFVSPFHGKQSQLRATKCWQITQWRWYYTACDCLLGFKEVNMINSPTKHRAESPTLQTLNRTGLTRPRHKLRSESPQDLKPYLRKCTVLTMYTLHFGVCPFTRGAMGLEYLFNMCFCFLVYVARCVCARLIYGWCFRHKCGGYKVSDILSRNNEARFIIERTLAHTVPLLLMMTLCCLETWRKGLAHSERFLLYLMMTNNDFKMLFLLCVLCNKMTDKTQGTLIHRFPPSSFDSQN